MQQRKRRQSGLPAYPSCAVCGELRHPALHVSGRRVLCFNCSDGRHRQGLCSQCFTVAPLEDHHPFGRDANRLVACKIADTLLITHQSKAVGLCQDVTEPLCLNCHAVVSARQAEPRYAAAKRRKTHG